MPAMFDPKAYTVGWICAVTPESVAARAFLDEEHESQRDRTPNDDNSYILGRIGRHNVVVASMPDGEYGTASAAAVAKDLLRSFPNVRIGLMVGIGGGAPSRRHDIRLGDVVVSSPGGGKGGVFQYDFGKPIQNLSFQDTGFLNEPPRVLRAAVGVLRASYEMNGHQLVDDVNQKLEKIRKRKNYTRPAPASDRLYRSDVVHPLNSTDGCDLVCGDDHTILVLRNERDEEDDDPAIHYGLIASGNQLMKDANVRDKLAAERDVLCFEMEAAGLMNHFPCLIIRGICDYADSHKNKEWQGFAAMMAAAYAKDLLHQIAPESVKAEKPLLEVLTTIQKDLHHLHQTADKTTAAVENMRSEQNILLVGIRNDVHDIKSSKTEDLTVARSRQFVMPFTSDPDFVNRSDIWTWIEEQHAGPVSRFALVGLGGFGKSQMAIQFAYDLRAVSSNASIFWVNGSSKATFEESYRTIANVLALPRRHDPDIDILALVRDWLQREDAGTWLMIVDNADDMEVFFSKESDQYDAQLPVASYLPKTETGKILVTSRSWDAAERLTGNGMAILKVPTMEEAQTLQLLKKKLGSDIDEAAALRLVQTLEYIPLAVSQAAAYIHKRSGRLTIQSYLEEFQKSEKRKGTLLRSDRGDIRRYEGVSNSIIVTWQVTFEQIKREQPRAASLLSLMSYFQAQNIPEYMLHDYNISSADAEESDNEGEEIGASDDFEDDLDVLRGYSLVALTSTLGFCEMHSLVQFCTKIWISKFGDSRRCERLFLKSASLHFPSGVFETWEQCQILMPHIQPLLRDEPIENRDRLEWSELLKNVSWYILMQGEYDRAEAVVQEAVRVRRSILGPEHPSTLTSMANLAATYRHQGRWEEAEKLDIQVMETIVTKLGADHPDTLSSIANLAATYWNQGRWEEAERLEVQVMETSVTKLGADHPDTLSSIANLASTYGNQGRWEEAERLEVQVMETRKTKLGADHPDTLSSMANLAFTWKDQGRRDDAIQLLQDCVERRQRCLGIDHPDTLSAKSNLVEWTEESDGDWTDESDC